MKAGIGSVVPLCLLFAGLTMISTPAAVAQDQNSNSHGPSKYLYLTNITLKPAMLGQFQNNERSRVEALRDANAPVHYVGMRSITGDDRVLFFSSYDSFAQMQKEHDATYSNAKLAETLRSGSAAEAPLLSHVTASVYEYREDLSLHVDVDISQMRFFDITVYKVRSGHREDFERLAKLYIKALGDDSDIHFATFEKMYGVGSDSVFIVSAPMKSLAEEDQFNADFAKLPSTIGRAQLQTLHELGSTAIASSEDDLFVVLPRISYAPSAWVTAQPDFWGKK